MSDDLEIIGQREILGKDCKIYGDIDTPLFLAKEVAEWIDYDVTSVNKLVALVEETEKSSEECSDPWR